MPKGGPQPGSGRPKGSTGKNGPQKATIAENEQKAIARQVIRDHITAHIPAIIEAQKENALGISYLVLRNKDGSYSEATDKAQVTRALAEGGDAFRVFTRQPHQGSAGMLLGYAADKPVEPQEHSGPSGGPIETILASARARHKRVTNA